MAALHIASCVIIFFPFWGANIGGYYFIVILPSLFYLGSHIIEYAETKKILRACLLVLFILQGARIILLTHIMAGGESIYRARGVLLRATSSSDNILGSLDPNVLGIPPSPLAIVAQNKKEHGGAEREILAHNLKGINTRNYYFTSSDIASALAKKDRQYNWIIIHKVSADEDSLLCRHGFAPYYKIIAHPENMEERTELVSLHSAFDLIDLSHIRAVGPNITIYSKGACGAAEKHT